MSTGVDGRVSQGAEFLNSNPNTRIRSSSRLSSLATAYSDESSKYPDSPTYNTWPATMAQPQRTRYLKTGAIVGVLLLMLFYLSPSRPTVSGLRQGKSHFVLRNDIELNLTDYPYSTIAVHCPPYRKVFQALRLVEAVDSVCAHD